MATLVFPKITYKRNSKKEIYYACTLQLCSRLMERNYKSNKIKLQRKSQLAII